MAKTFSNIIIISGMIYSLGIICYAGFRIFHPIYAEHLGNQGLQNFNVLIIIISFISILGFAYSLKIKDEIKTNLALLLASAMFTLYICEAILEFTAVAQTIKYKISPVKYEHFVDKRTKLQVLNELNKNGTKALPNVCPIYLLNSDGLTGFSGTIYPLSGVSNITTIFDNEEGYYPIIKLDEHGFNNPRGLYIKNKIDVALIGDSFTEGMSVQADESISAVLNNIGFSTISLGKTGNGPLIEFATMKEYAAPLQPKVVMLLYCNNDLVNLKDEMKSPFLKQYLENDDFTQDLINRQEEIDNVLIKFIEREWLKNRIGRILRLFNIRSIISLRPSPTNENVDALASNLSHQKDLKTIKTILKKSNDLVSRWGGKLYFVFLAPLKLYSENTSEWHKPGYDEDLIKMVQKLDIPVIDTHKEVFSIHQNPISLFPFSLTYHYNPTGYSLVAKAIAKRLSEDGIIPTKVTN